MISKLKYTPLGPPSDPKHAKLYEQGNNSCANCQAYRHTKCRPRLDGTLCSCSCEYAATNRSLHEVGSRSAGEDAEDMPVTETLAAFYPRVTKGASKYMESLGL